MSIRIHHLLIAAVAGASLAAVSGTPTDPTASALRAKEAKQAPQKEAAKPTDKVLVGGAGRVRLDMDKPAAGNETKSFDGLSSQSWVKDEDAKDKK